MSRSTSIRRRLVAIVVGAAVSIGATGALGSDATAAKSPKPTEVRPAPPSEPLGSRGVARW